MSNFTKTKEAMKEEREKLSRLSWPQKIVYIFNYYKIPILLIILAIAIAVFLITHMIGKKEDLLIGTFINVSVKEEGYEVLSDGFMEYIDGNPDDQMVQVLKPSYVDYSGQDTSEMNIGEVMKITAMISNQALDFMIMDESALENYAPQDGFVDLSQFLPEDLYAQLEPLLVTTTSLETGETYPVAIDISDTAYSKNYELSETPCYLSFLVLSPRKDACLEFLNYFLTLE